MICNGVLLGVVAVNIRYREKLDLMTSNSKEKVRRSPLLMMWGSLKKWYDDL